MQNFTLSAGSEQASLFLFVSPPLIGLIRVYVLFLPYEYKSRPEQGDTLYFLITNDLSH